MISLNQINKNEKGGHAGVNDLKRLLKQCVTRNRVALNIIFYLNVLIECMLMNIGLRTNIADYS